MRCNADTLHSNQGHNAADHSASIASCDPHSKFVQTDHCHCKQQAINATRGAAAAYHMQRTTCSNGQYTTNFTTKPCTATQALNPRQNLKLHHLSCACMAMNPHPAVASKPPWPLPIPSVAVAIAVCCCASASATINKQDSIFVAEQMLWQTVTALLISLANQHGCLFTCLLQTGGACGPPGTVWHACPTPPAAQHITSARNGVSNITADAD
jgi:hypothetical protein